MGGKKGTQNVRLEIEPVEQMDLLTEYVHVEVDPELAHKVVVNSDQNICKSLLSGLSGGYEQ